MSKTDTNPMNRIAFANAAARCTATSKRTGEQCKAPAVRGKVVCRFHGAYAGAPTGKRHGQYKHGGRTQEAQAVRKIANAMQRMTRETFGG